MLTWQVIPNRNNIGINNYILDHYETLYEKMQEILRTDVIPGISLKCIRSFSVWELE